ncbi:hypothetical protein [Variovorax sp. HJSM1_2]|uniref:hypothetical protein n=1 Tax=Variovorax sp. HJSM1_2 TaxID=3366263 RepID=UPI003BD5FA14
MPERTFQTRRHTHHRAHTEPRDAQHATPTQHIAVRPMAGWRNASGKAPDSLLPGVGPDYSNGDRRH